MSKIDRGLALVIFLLFSSSIIFYFYPQADARFSQLFWLGDHFIFTKQGIGRIFTVYLHSGMRWIFFTGIIIYLLIVLYNKVTSGRDMRPALRKLAYVVLATALSAGLVTNFILKDHWGRARPLQIEQFGGDKQLTPAWEISNQCRKNCSFVGGDVSFAFCLLAPALLVTRRRKLAVIAVCLFGTIVALGRIAAGAHFLSDCVIGALLTMLIVLISYKATDEEKPIHYFP
jgi:lipid A 4'-phosphatase